MSGVGKRFRVEPSPTGFDLYRVHEDGIGLLHIAEFDTEGDALNAAAVFEAWIDRENNHANL